MGKANKAGTGSDKKLAKKLAHEQALQRQARIRAAYAAGDPFTTLKPFASFQRNGLDATLEYATPDDLTQELKDWMNALLCTNMKQHYEEEWPTTAQDKKREMMASDARERLSKQMIEEEAAGYQAAYRDTADKDGGTHAFILVRGKETVGSADDAASTLAPPADSSAGADLPIAFVQYRFVEEDGLEVLYVYELQLTEVCRRKGLGKFLMTLVELLARKREMQGVMLTVQKINRAALRFYEALRYQIDESSPSQHDPLDESSYEIMSKLWEPAVKP